MGDSAAHLVAPLMSNKNVVFCRGLSFKATEADVRSMLADCGDILSVGMPVDARARPSGIANVEFASSDACARAIAKAASGITHMGRYIEIMPRGQRNDSWPSVPHPPDTVSASASEMTVSSSGLARILAAQPKKPVIRNRTPLRDDGSGDPANTASNSTRGPSASRQRTITPRRGQSDGQAPWRDPKNAGTPCTHRMPIDVACCICIGAELSGKLSPLEDYEREIAWIEHDLESANERFKCCQKALACLTQDKALLDEQVSEEINTRIQRSEERKTQIEALKTAKFNCRQLMFEISRSMPAAALQGDARRLCTQSDLKAQIKKLQEVRAPNRSPLAITMTIFGCKFNLIIWITLCRSVSRIPKALSINQMFMQNRIFLSMEFAKFGGSLASFSRLKNESVTILADFRLLRVPLMNLNQRYQSMRKDNAASHQVGPSCQEKLETAFQSETLPAMKSKSLVKC